MILFPVLTIYCNHKAGAFNLTTNRKILMAENGMTIYNGNGYKPSWPCLCIKKPKKTPQNKVADFSGH
jgi:hypothetical protein